MSSAEAKLTLRFSIDPALKELAEKLGTDVETMLKQAGLHRVGAGASRFDDHEMTIHEPSRNERTGAFAVCCSCGWTSGVRSSDFGALVKLFDVHVRQAIHAKERG